MPDLADELAAGVLARTEELAAIPAPPLAEGERAMTVAGWWWADGLARVRLDEVGNVWARAREGPGSAIVVCAHLDTVFAPGVAHGARREGQRLVGPGVGDDTVAVAALGCLARLLPASTSHPVWLLATVGEEGPGNLLGITTALARPPEPVRALIAVEGNYLGRVNVVGVGSVRWRVHVRGPGGHAWERAGAPSAVHGAAALVGRLACLAGQNGSKSAVNVGRIAGGEAVNARAQRCCFEVDLRADRADALAHLERRARVLLAQGEAGLDVTVEETGRRPAGRIDRGHPLVRTAVAALRIQGLAAELTAASTDANAGYAAGIPAITMGVTHGAGEHTEQEWIDAAAIPRGLRAIAMTVAEYDAEVW